MNIGNKTWPRFPRDWGIGMYSGDLKGDPPSGKGAIFVEQSGRYSGGIKDGRPHGQGAFLANGIEEAFEGEWREGVPLFTREEFNIGTDGWFELDHGYTKLRPETVEDGLDTLPSNLTEEELWDAARWYRRAWQLGLGEVQFAVGHELQIQMQGGREGLWKEFVRRVFYAATDQDDSSP